MKVLLIKDVYKLGRAGDVKRVADGYGRNYLLPQELAVLATPGALKQAERIRAEASAKRQELNQEMSGVAENIEGMLLVFPARASETGKLYGSITTQMIAESLSKKSGAEVSRRQIDSQPLRALGEHKVQVRLTVDLVPEITVIVHREGETPIPPGQQVEGAIPEEMETQVAESEAEETLEEAPVGEPEEAEAETQE